MNIDKKDLTDALYLSCVENYFLAWISKFYKVEQLYSNSFISISQVFDDFFCGANYENYSMVERVQNTAEKYGVVSHSYVKLSANEALNFIKNLSAQDLCLIRVKETFFEGFKRRAWRADHYICIDSELNWLNQYPLSEGKFTEENFFEIYDGAICLFGAMDLSIIPPDENKNSLLKQSFEDIHIEIGLQNLESATGILRITRKRLANYYVGMAVSNFFETEVRLLDKLYFDIRFQRIKKTKPEGEIYEKVKEIIFIEKEIWERLYESEID